MTTQIAVRLSDEMVAFVDGLVEQGARSRASVIEEALKRELQRRRELQDVAILTALGDEDPYPDLAGIPAAVAHMPLDLD